MKRVLLFIGFCAGCAGSLPGPTQQLQEQLEASTETQVRKSAPDLLLDAERKLELAKKAHADGDGLAVADYTLEGRLLYETALVETERQKEAKIKASLDQRFKHAMRHAIAFQRERGRVEQETKRFQALQVAQEEIRKAEGKIPLDKKRRPKKKQEQRLARQALLRRSKVLIAAAQTIHPQPLEAISDAAVAVDKVAVRASRGEATNAEVYAASEAAQRAIAAARHASRQVSAHEIKDLSERLQALGYEVMLTDQGFGIDLTQSLKSKRLEEQLPKLLYVLREFRIKPWELEIPASAKKQARTTQNVKKFQRAMEEEFDGRSNGKTMFSNHAGKAILWLLGYGTEMPLQKDPQKQTSARHSPQHRSS